MREAIATAEVGDDVFGDDPTVAQLETMVAELLGKEASVFLPSGTQSNLCALMAHCERGDEYIVSMDAHTYRYEAGGGAVLGSIQPQPLEPEPDGSIRLDKIRAAVKPIDDHFARTRLICLENTTGGKVLPPEYVADVLAIADEYGLSTHLDGARLFNAVVASDVPATELTTGFDTVSLCLSKGLGAPAGSVLSGSSLLIQRARRWRKMLGGTMRQVGILAAAGIWALENGIDRLADDHANARRLADQLGAIDEVDVDSDVPTNMVFAVVPAGQHGALAAWCRERDILLYAPSESLRLVLHRDVSAEDVDTIVGAFTTFFDRRT